jgi:ppGpp synthetase/RelA/SpoT-type nucleotidyltranferase
MKISNTRIDRLGDRIRTGEVADEDLQLLDEYRLSFSPAYEAVVGTLENALKLDTTGRPSKSTSSILDKLRRESLRLRQMQDIAGCRVVVSDAVSQDEVIGRLAKTFEETSVIDRRKNPSHGYRAVHVVVRKDAIAVEVQVRTELQHIWAQLSEKLSDTIDPSIKYGGGSDLLKSKLARLSENVGKVELLENRLRNADPRSEHVFALAEVKTEFKKLLQQMIEHGILWEDE